MNPISRTGALIALATAALTLTPGCKDFLDVNSSPNAIREAQVKTRAGQEALVVGLQTTYFDFYSGDHSRMASIFDWQMCWGPGLGRDLSAWNAYQMELDGPVQDLWNAGYHASAIADQIIQFAPAVNFGSDDEKAQIIGVAEVYKAMALGELAAFYGSIPIDIDGINAPPFATQAEAFARAQTLLSDAIAHFAASSTASLAQDLNFGGDPAMWTAIAHSVKARYYLAVSDYANALAESQKGIATGGTLNAIYTQSVGEYSPWGHFVHDEAGNPMRAEKWYIDLMKSDSGDARLAADFVSQDGGKIFGFVAHTETFKDSAELDPTLCATINKYSAYSDPFPLISYEENVLIRAEAAAQTGGLATAIADVNAIRSAAGLGATTATAQADVVKEILKQKQLQLFLEGQAYTDMRRTHTLPTGVPVRFIYPNSERNANPHTPAESDALVNALIK